MRERPKIKLGLTKLDIFFEIIGWAFMLAVWILVIANYSNLPDVIPIHYNIAGEADGFGGKENLLILPLVATVLFIGMTILNRFPHIFNYPTIITEDNVLQQYTNMTRIIRYLKFVLVLIFGWIAFRAIQDATGYSEGLGNWFSVLISVAIFIPLVYFIVKSLRIK